jgi:ribosome-associated protein
VPIVISDRVVIPDHDLDAIFVRASGPGGQNVNKVSSAVQLRFNLADTRVLSAAVKDRLRVLAGRRVIDDGSLLIIARTQRTQERNRAEAQERLAELIRRALVEPVRRRATKPTRASKERRLGHKAKHTTTKRRRAKPGLED